MYVAGTVARAYWQPGQRHVPLRARIAASSCMRF
jgi:hypothetical protein